MTPVTNRWPCRSLYMTRVSDGFRLPLERDHGFRESYAPKSAQEIKGPARKP